MPTISAATEIMKRGWVRSSGVIVLTRVLPASEPRVGVDRNHRRSETGNDHDEPERRMPDIRVVEQEEREEEREADVADKAQRRERSRRPVDGLIRAHENALSRGLSFSTFWSASIASRSAFVSFFGTDTF